MTIATKIRQLAFAALALAAPAASAALTYTDGDLILGVRATGGQGGTQCYEVNLGPATQFVGVGAAFTVNTGGNIAADLETVFGADWKTRGDVFWSVSGTQYTAGNGFTNRTMFASKAEVTAGTQSTPWARSTLSTQSIPAGKLAALGTQYGNGTQVGTPGQTESTHSTKALTQDNGKPNSYADHMPGGGQSTVGSAYSYFVNGALGIENTFTNGTASSVIDLYQLSTGTNGTPGVFLGAFRMNDSGVLTFTNSPGDFVGAPDVAFSSATYSVLENGGTATLTLHRAGNTNTTFTVNVSTGNVTATAGTDYTALTSFPVVFAVGEATKDVNVAITDVAGFQGDRTFTASLALASGSANLITPSTATVTITENDPQPSTLAFSAATYSVLETGAQATATIQRTGSTTGSVSVNFSTQNGTALAGTNFTGQTNTVVTFGDGETSKTVDVLIADIPTFTGDRTFTIALSGGTNGATVGSPGTAVVTITETDANPAGQIAFSAATFRFASKDALGQPNTVVLTLNRTNGTTGAVSAQVALAGGTLDALDFNFTSPVTVDFADGQATASVNIPLLAGAAPLPGTMQFTLGNATNGASIGAIAAATVTVTAPEKIAPKLLLTSPKAGKSGALFDIAGTVVEPDDLARVAATLNGIPLGNAQLGVKANGVTPFTLNAIPAENGPNTLLIQAFDVNGTASLVKTVHFTYINERPQLAGNYNGLATPTAVAPPANDLHNASGLVSVKVTKTGAFTGKVAIGGARLVIKGVFANNGGARFGTALTPTFALVKKGKVPVTFGDLTLAIAASKVTGTIGLTATVDCDRAAFDGNTSLVDAAVLANKGVFTAVLPSETQPVLTTTQFPQGDGVGVITVTKAGKLSFEGTLADGTPFAASAPLSAGYTAPLYAPLYAKKGSIAGIVTISLADLANPNANSDISGDDFLWLRPADAKAKYYPAGWAGGVDVDLIAASYNGAKQTPAVSVFPGLNATGGATIQFADGKLAGLVTKDVLISTANKVTNVPATDKSYKLTIVAPTGALGGSFTHSDGKKPTFKGIIYQKGPTKGGYGYFLSVFVKGGPTGEGGGVSISPKP